nr:MAG TPA: hypothetical protein [Caudoviricetes sp.]
MINIKTQEFRTVVRYRVTSIHKQSRTAFVNDLKVGDQFYICTKLHGERTQAGYLAPRVRLYFPEKNKYTKYTTQERMQQIFGFNFSAEPIDTFIEPEEPIIEPTQVTL